MRSPHTSINTASQSRDNYKFSFFKAPIHNVTPTKTESLEGIYQLITSDKYESITRNLRTAQDKSKRSDIKGKGLDYVTFSGEFSTRSNKALIKHSNLLCVDIDDVDDIASLKSKIVELLPPTLLFISPSGNGLKIIYKIDTTKTDTHLDYFKAFQSFFEQELNLAIDKACKDVSRACFLCHDKDAYFIKDADVLDRSFIDTFFTEQQPNTPIQMSIEEIIKKLKTWLNKKENFASGNRNNYITKLAGAYNRYGIPQDIAENDLLSFVEDDFTESEIKATVKSIYKNTQWYNTAQFEENIPYDFKTDKPQGSKPKKTPLLPIDGFPEEIQKFINEYTETYNTPRDYIAGSVLFSMAVATGDRMELTTLYKNIPLLWMCIVGQVSSGKTEPLKTCLNFFHKKDETAYKMYNEAKVELEKYNKLSKADQKNTPEPKKPKYYQTIISDYTPESLCQVHTTNSKGICIYRDELKGWLDDFNRYSKSGEQSTMLSTFYRQPMQINRATKEPIFIPKPAIFVCGGIQPELLKDLADDSRGENGFLARMLFIYPDNQKKRYYSSKTLDPTVLKEFSGFLAIINNIMSSVKLTLSPKSQIIHNDWYNKNADISNDEKTGYLKGVYGKLDVICLRIAIVIHAMKYACENDQSTQISESTMQSAIDITEYFRSTALKVYDDIFGERVKNISTKDMIIELNFKGLSQTEIATIVGVKQQYVSKVLKRYKL